MSNLFDNGTSISKRGKIIEAIDCTPDWLPIVKYALQWIKDAKQFEKSYRKDCTDYDGAMEDYTGMIMDCAKGLDMMNKRAKMAKQAKQAREVA